MIRMLPEGFFSDMVIRVGVIFIVLLACRELQRSVQLERKRKKLVKLIKGFKYINFNNNGGYVTMK